VLPPEQIDPLSLETPINPSADPSTRDAVLLVPRPGYPTVTLEMIVETLHRWLLGRVDLAARLREGTVTAYGARDTALHGFCARTPHTPWAFHLLDWI
jgi:hypothetical protein